MAKLYRNHSRSTASDEIKPFPTIESTETTSKIITEEIGFGRSQVRELDERYTRLHEKSFINEWQTRTNSRKRAAPTDMLNELGELGFAWRDIAKLLGVSVPAVQKWRRGDGVSGTSRHSIASLLAACDLITEHYEVQEIASWFESPLLSEVPLTPLEFYAKNRADLVFRSASGHDDPEQILTEFEPDWRDRYDSAYETFRADDGHLSIRRREM